MGQESFFDKLAHPAYSWIEGHLDTNTWKRRHEKSTMRAKEVLTESNATNITIALYGAGGIAEEFADKLPEGDESLFRGSYLEILRGKEIRENIDARMRRVKQQWIGRKETEARDKPESRLVTFEPVEVYWALKHLGINYIHVYDRQPKVIDAVKRLEIKEIIPINRDLDNVVTPFAERYDVVIARRFFEYCKNLPRASQHVLNSVKQNGWLILTQPEKTPLDLTGFVKKAEGVYYRGSRFSAPRIDELAIEPYITGEK